MKCVSDALNELDIRREYDIRIVRQEPAIVIWFILGPICLLCGVLLLSVKLPNYSIGFPSFTIGLALCFFGLTRYYSVQSAMMMKEINQRLKKIEGIVEKWDFD
jgi:hypothetical protein